MTVSIAWEGLSVWAALVGQIAFIFATFRLFYLVGTGRVISKKQRDALDELAHHLEEAESPG